MATNSINRRKRVATYNSTGSGDGGRKSSYITFDAEVFSTNFRTCSLRFLVGVEVFSAGMSFGNFGRLVAAYPRGLELERERHIIRQLVCGRFHPDFRLRCVNPAGQSPKSQLVFCRVRELPKL